MSYKAMDNVTAREIFKLETVATLNRLHMSGKVLARMS
jgi:hypothetical protein